MAFLGNQVVKVPDKPLRITSANSFNGTAATKGTATDLVLTIVVTPDGTSSFAGNVTYVVQGSNDGSTYTAVTPDKGSLNSDTAANVQTAHFANLQYKQYRLQPVGASSPLMDVVGIFEFLGLQDSFDDSTT